MVHELMWGAETNGTVWLGVMGVSTSISSIINDLKTTLPNKISSRFSDNAWMTTDYPALITELEAIYNKFKAVTVTNPDPLASSATKIPTMFEYLGPHTQTGTSLYPPFVCRETNCLF